MNFPNLRARRKWAVFAYDWLAHGDASADAREAAFQTQPSNG